MKIKLLKDVEGIKCGEIVEAVLSHDKDCAVFYFGKGVYDYYLLRKSDFEIVEEITHEHEKVLGIKKELYTIKELFGQEVSEIKFK